MDTWAMSDSAVRVSLVVGLRCVGVPIRFGFQNRNPQNMFAQLATAFHVCRDTVTAALTEQQKFQDEVRGLLKKKDEEIAELKGQLTVNLQEVKVLREQMKMEADLTAVDVRGF